MPVKTKRYFLIILATLLLTDLAIIIDIPGLAQVAGCVCFMITPGLLLLAVFRVKLEQIGAFKSFVLAVGLSLAFLIFAGLVIDILLPLIGVSHPLSPVSLLISFNLMIIALAAVAYGRNKSDLHLPSIPSLREIKQERFLSLLIFPLLFPLLAILGTYHMNNTGNNLILLTTLFLIPAYVIVVTLLRQRIPQHTYPVAIWMIGLALLLMHALTSNYLSGGGDVWIEYINASQIASAQHWDITELAKQDKAFLSISLLPTILSSLLNVSLLAVFKVINQILWSLAPLVCFLLVRKYVGEVYAFLSSFFFMAQLDFIFVMQAAQRQEIAILFFALAMLVFFEDRMGELNKSLLFIIFIAAVVVSHYATAGVFLIMLSLVWLVKSLAKNLLRPKMSLTFYLIALFSAIAFFWYAQVMVAPFEGIVGFTRDTLRNFVNFFVAESRGAGIHNLLGQGLPNLAEKIWIAVHDVTFVFIIIGTLGLVREFRKTKFEPEYILMAFILLATLGSMFIVPFLSKGYDPGRMYVQTMVILAPTFILGGQAICRFCRIRFSLAVVLLVLTLQFFSATYVIHQCLGVPYSMVLNREGYMYGLQYVHDEEVVSAGWIKDHSVYYYVYSDYGSDAVFLFISAAKPRYINARFFERGVIPPAIPRAFLYFRKVNCVDGEVHVSWKDVRDIGEYSYFFAGKNLIYDNGASRIFWW